MLFTKEITKITFENVVDFCNEQIKESINLDYKKDFPADLAKTIASFANTTGGLIIIGVEDKDGKPKLPVKGLEYKRGFSEKVTSIILSNIYPPVFPEIQVCDPIKNRTFVIIRVPQSNMTPHYILHRTKIYIRTGDITQPEKLAPAEQVEWLWNRRSKSEELKKLLYITALKRYKNHIKLHNLSIIPFGEATISIIPFYPTRPFKTSQEMEEVSKAIKANGYRDEFPHFQHIQIKPVQGGVVGFLFDSKGQNIDHYTELNQFGFLYHKENLGNLETVKIQGVGEEQIKQVKRVSLLEIIQLIDLFLEASANLYEELGYWGLVEFTFSLEKLLGVELVDFRNRAPRPQWKQDNISVDEKLKWRRVYYVNEIKNKRIELLIELLKNIGWDLGWEDKKLEDKIKSVFEKYGRLSK